MMKKNILFGVLAGLGFSCGVSSAVQAQEAATVQTEAAVVEAATAPAEPTVAQGEPTEATVGFSAVKMALSKGKVRVTMGLDFSKLKVRGEYYFTPRIADEEGHELQLPSVVMAARNFYLMHQRARDLASNVRLYEHKTIETVDYEAVVDYEPWMKTAVLDVEGLAIPVPAVWEDELQDVSATSLVSGLAAALAQDGEGAVDLPEELQTMTLTPEMQAVLTEALKTIALQAQGQQPQAVQDPAPDEQQTLAAQQQAQATQQRQQQLDVQAQTLEEQLRQLEQRERQLAQKEKELAEREQARQLAQQQAEQAQTQPQPAVAQQPATRATAQTQPAPQPVFEPVFVYRTPAAEPHKLRTEKGTAHIEFRLNGTGIDPSWRDNRAELDKIKRTLEALSGDADYTLKAMAIKGYASPEGTYEVNAGMAAARMKTVKAYIQSLIDLPAGRISTAYEAEDWAGLQKAVEASNLPHKAGILEIMADVSLTPDAREDKIKKQYPADYADMLSQLYPALRHVDYEVEYEVRAYAEAAEIVRLLNTQPQKLSLQEIYLAAQTMEAGGADYNEAFEIAVRLFPSDETANLNAANSAMRWRDLQRAGRYLGKAGQSAEAVYARGNHAALRGDYEAAANYFKQAVDQGVNAAAAAMERLRTLQEAETAQPEVKAAPNANTGYTK